jgi:hypothetical protein
MKAKGSIMIPKNRIKYIVLWINDLLDSEDQIKNVNLMGEYRGNRLVFINQRFLEKDLILKKWKFFVMVDPVKKIILCREGAIYPTSEIMGYFVFQICFGKILKLCC